MSGHSKWKKIKGQKGAADAKRGALFSKLSRQIMVAAKEGGPDPSANFKLRLTVDQARSASMPKDNIERAIARGAGTTGEGEQVSEMIYEAFGPGGVAMLVEAITDNKNRTTSNIKTILGRHGASLAGAGRVMWQFERKGVVRVGLGLVSDREEFELEMIDAGAEDIKDEEGAITITASQENLQKIIETLANKNLEPEYSGLEWIPKNTVTLDEKTQAKLEKLGEVLDEDDDVTNYATNEA